MSSASNTTPTQAGPQTAAASPPDGFELNVALLEVSDSASLVNVTNDGCGSTCGACTTGVA